MLNESTAYVDTELNCDTNGPGRAPIGVAYMGNQGVAGLEQIKGNLSIFPPGKTAGAKAIIAIGHIQTVTFPVDPVVTEYYCLFVIIAMQ